MDTELGSATDEREEIASGLSKILTDTFTLYHQTHRLHWHLRGTTLQALDAMLHEQYGEVRPVVEAIATRIRELGFAMPDAYADLVKLTSIWEDPGLPDHIRTLQLLADAHDAVARTARGVFKLAARARDERTCDLMLRRMQIHETTAWMLRNLAAWETH